MMIQIIEEPIKFGLRIVHNYVDTDKIRYRQRKRMNSRTRFGIHCDKNTKFFALTGK